MVHTIAFGGRAFYNEEKAFDTCLAPVLLTPIGARREPGLSAKGLGGVRLAGEAEGEGDLAEGTVGVAQGDAGGFKSPRADILAHGSSEGVAESGCQVYRMHPRVRCERGKR